LRNDSDVENFITGEEANAIAHVVILHLRAFIMIRGKEFQSVVYSFAPLFFSCQYHSGDVASIQLREVGTGGGSGAAMLVTTRPDRCS